MRLRITDPTEILIDCEVRSVRAEDASGSFGILDGHADFVTALDVSVVSWRDAAGLTGYCAVHNGILTVSGGTEVAIATREGFLGNDLDALRTTIAARYGHRHETEHAGRTAAAKLRMKAIRHMVETLQGGPKELGL